MTVRGALGALDRYWFVEGRAARLALLRILVGLGTLVYLTPRRLQFSEIAASSPALFEPAGVVTLLKGPLATDLFAIAVVVLLLANVAFVLGWQHAWTGPLFAASLVGVMCYRNSWSMIYHTENLLVLHGVILGMTRSADALSVDAWLAGRARRGAASASGDGVRRHWEYGYPIRLLCAVAVLTYVLSGIAKVSGPLGWGWALGEGLRTEVGFDALRKELMADGAQPLAWTIYNNLALASVLGVGTLLLELGSPVALVSRRLGWAWAVMTYGMHWGIYATMGITFWYQLAGLAFVPFLLSEGIVSWCGQFLGRWRRRAGTARAADDSEAASHDRADRWDTNRPAGVAGRENDPVTTSG